MPGDGPDPKVALEVFRANHHHNLVNACPPNNVILVAVAAPVGVIDGRPAYVPGGQFVMAPADLDTARAIQVLQSVCEWVQRTITENERRRVVSV